MASKPCLSCNKTVYQAEQFKFSDGVWHKGCFRCKTCSLQLNAKNAKLHEKVPYCNTHYPTQRSFTVMADTPELQRVQKSAQVVSAAAYKGEVAKKADQERRRADINAPPVASKPKPAAAASTTVERYQAPAPAAPAAPAPSASPAPAAASEARSSRGSYGRPSSGIRSESPAAARQPSPLQAAPAPPAPEPEPEPEPEPAAEPKAEAPAPSGGGKKYRAQFDYEAQDEDEVELQLDDIVVDPEVIDDGWMIGTNSRTGRRGMLPSNYVEPLAE